MLDDNNISKISIILLTNNSERYIYNVLESIKIFPEIIVIDTGSIDNTLKILAKFSNVKVFHRFFSSFGALRNEASDLAKNDWILSIDSDEILSPEAIEEILMANFDDGCVYSFRFKNIYKDRWIKCCGWYPDIHVRLFNKKVTNFNEELVHEDVVVNNVKVVNMESHIIHYSYYDLRSFLKKMQLFVELFAIANVGKKHSSFFIAISHGLFSFLKSYIFRRGIFFGETGFLISFYKGCVTFFKYLRLKELNSIR